jgi:predicted LPLAT superfamily acyltransferase
MNGASRTGPADEKPAPAWAASRERSNRLALQFMAWVALRLGRRAARWLLHPIALYYLVFAPTPRRHSERYLARALGSAPTWRDAYRHILAFASVVLAWQKETGADMSKVNVNGGAIALGHPLGASGTKLMATLLNELERTGGRYGLQVMCEGGGMANATIIERLD